MVSQKQEYALITGATSGIGYELAKQIAYDGYNLVLVARDEEELRKVAKELKSTSNEVILIPKDLFNENAAQEIYQETKAKGVKVTLLINNAGQGQYGEFIEEDLDRHLDIIRLNIVSLVSLTHLYLKEMIRMAEGKILQVGSEVSKAPSPLLGIYAATKAFVLSFTESLINELKDTDITVTLLMPGVTDTDFFDKADMEDTKTYREFKLDPPEKVAEIAYQALMKGERRVIGPAGVKNVAIASITPDNLVAANMRRVLEPSEKDDDEVRHEPTHQRSKEIKEKSDLAKGLKH